MNKKNLAIEQTCFGIEQFAIGRQFYKNNPRKKFPLQDLIGILEEAHKGLEASESLILDTNKNYSNYRRKIQDEFGIEINFQKRIPKNLKNFEPQIPALIKIYLKKHSFEYSDFLVNKYFMLLKNTNELENSLYTIVYLGIAAMLKTTVEIIYKKMHGKNETKTYRLIPCDFISSTNYL